MDLARLAPYAAFQRPAAPFVASAAAAGTYDAAPLSQVERIERLSRAAAQLAPRFARAGGLSETELALGRRRWEAWWNDNGPALAEVAKTAAPGSDLPPALRFELPPAEARAFVLGLWMDATAGLGLFETGYAWKLVSDGTWTPDELEADLVRREKTMQLLSVLDAEGRLEAALREQPLPGDGGLGWLPAFLMTPKAIGIIVGVVALLVAIYLAQTIIGDWLRMRQLLSYCKEAKAAGDQKTADRCDAYLMPPPSVPPTTVAIVAIVGAGLVFGLVHLTVPKLLDRSAERRGG